jgi:hypothetical protein
MLIKVEDSSFYIVKGSCCSTEVENNMLKSNSVGKLETNESQGTKVRKQGYEKMKRSTIRVKR